MDFFLRQVGQHEGAAPRIDCPKADGGFVVIHPFASSRAKQWPLERFREVARRIGRPVEWCAGPEEELEGAKRFEDLYELACRLAVDLAARDGVEFEAAGGLTMGADHFAHGIAMVADCEWFVVRKAPKGRGTDKVVEEVSYEGPDLANKRVTVDGRFVCDKLGPIVQSEDLSKFIL